MVALVLGLAFVASGGALSMTSLLAGRQRPSFGVAGGVLVIAGLVCFGSEFAAAAL